MEALLEKEGKVENWNDDRLDELNRRVDTGFERAATKAEVGATRQEMNRRFDEVNRRMDDADARSHRFEIKVGEEFGRVTDRLDKLFFIQLAFLASLSAALITHTV
jgi:hypothetical protein